VGEAERKELDRLSVTHPDYMEWEKNWKLYRDVLGDSEPKAEDYLPRGEFEDDDVYKTRVALSEFIPESPIPVNKLVGAIYTQQPTRDLKSTLLDSFTKNVDLKGTVWPEFAERVCRKLIGYGTTRVLVNVRRSAAAVEAAAGGVLSVSEETKLGIRPFAINYSPLAVIDWETDEFGLATMVVIKEKRKVRSKGEEPGHDTQIRIIRYNQETVSWTTFLESSDGKVEKIGTEETREHKLGMVPMVIENYPEEIRPMIGGGFIRYIAKADLRKIRAESDLHYDTYVHAHPLFYYKGVDELGTIGVGGTTYLKIKIDEEIGYVQLPPATAEAVEKVIKLNLDTMHRHAGTDPLGQIESGFQASGTARAWAFGTSEGRVLKDIASTMQRVETRILDMAERLAMPESERTRNPDELVFKGTIQYSEEYDPTGTEQLMVNTETSQGLVNSETFHKLQSKRVAVRLAGEVPPDVLKKILDEIEKNPLQVSTGPKPEPFSLPEVEINSEGREDGEGGEPPTEKPPEEGAENTPARPQVPRSSQKKAKKKVAVAAS